MKRAPAFKGGYLLLTVLIFISIATVICYNILIYFNMHPKATLHRESTNRAERAAESALSQAIINIRQNPAFGTTSDTYVISYPMPSTESIGNLTFDPSSSNRSVNNWRKDTPYYAAEDTQKTKVLCPANAIHLIATGSCRDVTRQVEVLLAAPPFSSAIASRGAIRSTGGMVLGSLPQGYDMSAGIDLTKLRPASIESSASDDASGPALKILGTSTLVGTGKVAGTATFPEQKTFTVQQGAEVNDIPNIDLSTLAFTNTNGVQTLPTSTFTGAEKLSGQVQWSSAAGESLVFSSGLNLNGATLQLKGNVVISGGITGAGALLVDGNVTIRGQSSFEADNMVAIVASGGVSLSGSSQENSVFRGLVYAGGAQGAQISDVALMGTLVNAGKTSDGKGAPTEIDRATIAYVPNNGVFSFDPGWGGVATTFPVGTGRGANGDYLTLAARNGHTPPKPSDFPAGYTFTANDFFVSDASGNQLPAADQSRLQSDFVTANTFAPGSPLSNLQSLVAPASSTGNPLLQNGVFKLDLNQFIQTSGQLHIVWMKR